jgi:antitoxin YefM
MAMTASEARKNLFPLLEQVNTDDEPVQIRSRRGDAVLISMRRYRELRELIEQVGAQAATSPLEARLLGLVRELRQHPEHIPDTQFPQMDDVLIEVDDRRRVTLGKLAGHRRYLAHAEGDGTVVLTPAVVMPEDQARLLARPDVMDAIDAFAADPEATGVRRPRPVRRPDAGHDRA